MDDVLRPVPQMGQQLRRASGEKPDEVADDDVPADADVRRGIAQQMA